MQDCFRAHPDIYGAELEEEETEAGLEVASPDDATPPSSKTPESAGEHTLPIHESSLTDEVRAKRDEIKAAAEKTKKEEPASETDELVPRVWHDSESSNEEKKP